MYTEQMYNNSLAHHGILGQKWGIRRYQNYDGSYTQAGMKRYNKSLEEYNKKDESYKEAKKAYKAGTGTEADMVNKKVARRQAKNKLNKDYKHLKQDKLGDQGKKLYAEGHTITGDNKITRKIAASSAFAGTAARELEAMGILNKKASTVIQVGSAITLGAAFTKEMIDNNKAKKLRAYYNHTSKY